MQSTTVLPLQLPREFLESYQQFLFKLARESFERAQEGSTLKPYMNKKEAAQYIGVSFNTLQKFIENGLPMIEVENVKLLSKKDIDEYLESNKK
ncbi:helix-turn-helix domain-containing protein [Bacillus sp. V3B]|uniref:helix-turn-helix domain-containing protein n=1 Tax=Bacillus sp. V3B TaxID=2804915 RepID=UPI002108A8E3|nr:helix-turn-helix domain-containing protein [Bacillus sp. V3B]MCQ6276412.1 helix-turn-helix domain-containing protein [Bacillus sp. V3B]